MENYVILIIGMNKKNFTKLRTKKTNHKKNFFTIICRGENYSLIKKMYLERSVWIICSEEPISNISKFLEKC